MDPQDKDEKLEAAAQEMFGRPFAELEPHERVRAGGKVGGGLKGSDLADPARAPPPPDVQFGEDNPAPGEGGETMQKEQQLE